jgi:hypothetical protein
MEWFGVTKFYYSPVKVNLALDLSFATRSSSPLMKSLRNDEVPRILGLVLT